MLERFMFKPSESLATKKPNVVTANPVLEGYQILTDLELESARIIEEHVLSTYHGTAQDAPEIVMEGLRDMLESAVTFFKELIRKMGEFFKRSALYLGSMFMSFDKFIDKYKDQIITGNKSYSVWGYQYTLDQRIPKTEPMTNMVAEFNREIGDITNIKKGEIAKRRSEFVNEGTTDKLRGQILGKGTPVEATDFREELKRMFRAGQDEEKEIRVDNILLKTYVEEFKKTKRMLDDVRQERTKIENVYRSLESFFAKGTKLRYVEGNKRVIANKADAVISGKDSSVSYKDEVSYGDTYANNDVINYYFSFKWTQAQAIGAMSFQCYVERINAIKEAMSFYEKTIRRAIFAKSEEKGEDE